MEAKPNPYFGAGIAPRAIAALVMYRRSAERAFSQLTKGDNFVAEGYVHPYSYERDEQTITAEEAQVEWLEMNAWINWLRNTYGLNVGVIPPLWHRHPEPVWELSALRQHWLSAYQPKQHGSVRSAGTATSPGRLVPI